MKKYLLFIIIIISLFTTACRFQYIEESSAELNNISETSLNKNSKYVTLSGRIDSAGANNSRTAVPSTLPPLVYMYEYICNGQYSEKKDLTLADGKYSIQIPVSDTSVEVRVYASDSADPYNFIMTSSVIFNSVTEGVNENHDFVLSPITGGYGSVKLMVASNVPGVTHVYAEPYLYAGFYLYDDPHFQDIDISSGSGFYTMNAATVQGGIYRVDFYFKSSDDVTLYSCSEIINVCQNLETDCWKDNGSIHINTSMNSGKGALFVDSACVSLYDRHEFYVGSTGNFGVGTYFDPVDFKTALKYVNSLNDGNLYTIYLREDYISRSDYSDWDKAADGVTPVDSFVTINPSIPLKLKIASYGNPATPYKIDANRSVDYPGRVMYIGEKAEVTLENITVTGGCSKLHGAGIFINSSTLTMNAKTAITSNYFAIDGKSGAGIYCEYGTIIMNNGAEISYNGNTEHLANGGGLYLKGSDSDLTKKAVIKMEPGSKNHHNVGYSGAGLKILYGSDSYFHGAEITDNKAIYTSNDNGGGVWSAILSGNSLEITDTTLKNNTVNCGTTGGGGAIYVHLGSVVINGTTTFENNSGVTGNAIRMLNSSNQHIMLSDSVIFDNTNIKQTVAYDYSSTTGAPYIKLGTLTGTVADQTVYLTISPLTLGNPVLVPDSAAVNIADYADRFIVLNTDLTPSAYKIDSNGKLAEKAVIGPNGGNASSAYTDVTPFGDGTGITAAGNYSISTKDELNALAAWATTNATANYTFVLYDNIDLENTPFSPIGGSKNFAGTFDGNGNKITGLSINSSSQYTGLFGKGSSCTIKNLYVEGKITSSAGIIGGIIGTTSAAGAIIDNCVSNVDITCTFGGSVGGIVGSAGNPVTNCVNLGKITGSSDGSCVGGIAGTSGKNIINCANFGAVTGHMNVAGICGQLDTNGIANCYNYGKITADSSFGAIEGKGTAGSFSELYYHPNSGVTAAVYNKVDDIEDDIGTFTDPEALRLTLNANLLNPAYSSLSLSEWNYDYKIDGVNFPVCTTFALPEKIGVNLSDLASAPSDNSVPYIMKTQSDIEKLAGWVNSGLSFAGFEFKIPEEVSDIDLSGNWTPIGTSSNPFKGTFDGNNVKISSVSISGSNYRGFFGYIDGATIKNLTIEGSLTVTGSDCGGLVGSAKGNVVIDNCDVKMAITGNNTGARLGGILGNYDGASSTCLYIQNCINRGTVSGGSNVGGVAGYIYSYAASPSYIYNCANYGGVTGAQGSVGGIAGSVTNTVVENCLCNPAGSVSGLDSVGKICGKATANSELNYCYYLDYSADSEDYKGTTAGTTLNCNVFRVMDTKYQVYNAGNSVIGTYPADTDLCDIMNDWVNYKNTISPGYLSWKYESSQMEFTN